MWLGVNIGNSRISFGIFKDRILIKRFDFFKEKYNLKRLKIILKRYKIDKAIICSVVPYLTKKIKKELRGFLKIKIYIVGKDINVPMKNLYRNPQKLGQDRLLNAYAGAVLYGAPCIVIDLGTAITFDIVSKYRTYLGGMILPGLDTSLKALSDYTSLLPYLKLKKPKEFIGKDTENCILSGIVYGFSFLIDGLIEKIKKNFGDNFRVIGTGGDISFMAKYCKTIQIIDKDLIFKGLALISR